ncbi:hypothetical protein VNO78_06121 [Psophocarpus tetragonolobus]|uniref:C3H1-type domain-containing protein n=1 Tax=Psophocarpus tetragonolobus TaxID=3891 RepID=A0AAN9T0W7_PSOTE
MSTMCSEHKLNLQLQPSHHPLISLKNSLGDIHIPPRKLLTRRSPDMETLLHRCHSHNNDSIESSSDDDDPYASDTFRMFEFKVRRCTRSRSHDWTDCPFAHPGEKARRRDPRQFHYSGTVCPEYRRGHCSLGDSCEYSHGVFECWLHPSRYRTEACKDGKNCKRKVCFFAHTRSQLRVLPPHENLNRKNCTMYPHNHNTSHCCMYAPCSSSTFSPTSTLFGMSHFSPPLSRPSSPNSPFETNHQHAVVNYKDLFSKLMCSVEALNLGEASPSSAPKSQNFSWLDVSENHRHCSILSPPITSSGRFQNNGNGRFFREESGFVDDVIAPDLAWVNELLM